MAADEDESFLVEIEMSEQELEDLARLRATAGIWFNMPDLAIELLGRLLSAASDEEEDGR